MAENFLNPIDETLRLTPFTLHYGDSLPDARVSFRLVGNEQGPVVVVLGGISAHRIVTGAPGEGWWPEMVGPGLGVDTRQYRVLGIDYIGGRGDSATPSVGGQFPPISSYDQAGAIAKIVQHLGLRSLHAIVGASYGGMVALCFAERYPTLVGHIVVLSAADRSQVLSTAWRSVQRQIVREAIARGDGASGLKLARALAMATYRSNVEFAIRFGGAPKRMADRFRFPIEEYLFARGDDYVQKYRAESFLTLSESIDLHEMDATQVHTPATLIAVREDQLVPFNDMQALSARLNGPRQLIEINSIFGHDAFLKEGAALTPVIKHALVKSAIAGALALILVVVGYMSWRHSRPVTPSGSGRIMLAVLPFANLTGDPNMDYLADGLTEETISQLGRLNPERLGVIARTSVMGYKHKDVRLDQIGRDLSVQYVLENSLRESGDHLRLTAQLIQVKDQTHVWSQNYDYPAKDILTVQDEVAKAVAREIQLRLTSQLREKLAQTHPANPEAFDAYLQGYHFFQGRSDKDVATAAKYFERATQLDPSYALAWAWLSRARKWQANEGLIPMEEGDRLAREAVERALALDPNLAMAHAQMGRIKQQVDYDWAGASASFQRAVTLEPGNPEYIGLAAFAAAYFRRFDDALQLHRRAIELDPLNAGSWESLAGTESMMGQLDQSAADSKKALEMNPDYWSSPILLSRIYLLQGRPQDALAEIEHVHIAAYRAHLYALTYYALGRKKESDAALRELMTKYQSNAFEIATVYAFRNQPDEAFKWLDRAYAQRDPSLMATNVEPLLNSLHKDPRYAAFLKKIHLPA